MIAKASKNKTCWLPAIKVDSLKMRRISPKSSFLGYINKSAAIYHAKMDIKNNNLCDYK